MEYSFSALGKKHTLNLEGDSEKGYKATLDEDVYDVKLFMASQNRLILEVNGDRKVFYVAESKDKVFVLLQGRQYILEKIEGSDEFKGADTGFSSGELFVNTPMPGRIVKVLVKEEDMVELNQAVFVIESMKMENDVRSMNKGRVKRVLAAPGDALNHGDPVIEFYPAEEEKEED